jgi:predicted transcriptional regulator
MNSNIENMTEHELLKAILEARKIEEDADDKALTMAEICEKLEMSDKKARKLVKELMSIGLVEVLYVQRETIMTPLTGSLYPKPGYRLKNGD